MSTSGHNNSGLVAGPSKVDLSIEEFAKDNSDYYAKQFAKIQGTNGFAFSWNTMAAVFGPMWGALRGVWGFFWTFLVLELFALVQIGRGLWGELGANHIERYEKLMANIAKREQQAKELIAAGQQADADSKLKIADNLKRVALETQEKAELASSEAFSILMTGLIMLVVIKLVEGLWANRAYEKQYLQWRAKPNVQAGPNRVTAIFGALLLLAIWPLTLFRFTVSDPDAKLSALTGGFLGGKVPITEFPINREYFSVLAKKGDAGFDWLASNFSHVFEGITAGIRAVLNGLEIVLIQTPWPVVMIVIVVMAQRLAGNRVAIFTAASLLYLAFMGLWEISMITVAALGMRGVPETTKEAAVAFGCSKWQLLRNVELPLAMPSIMTGINQTILMSLSMVVIASLIGAEGLGALILEALQYAAKGQGLLGGLAILLCAMVIDRIAQGMYRKKVGADT